MKRDIDLVRKILMSVEAKESPDDWLNIEIEGYSPVEISYHVKILAEAGYLDARDLSSTGNFEWAPVNLTWEGHEFLDAARDTKIWNKAKGVISEKASSVSFEILKAVLLKIGMRTIGM